MRLGSAGPALVLIGLRVHGIVDRVESGWAVVEWEGESLSDVPIGVLPEDVREGDGIVAVLRRRPGGVASWDAGGVVPPGWSLVRTVCRRQGAGHARSRREPSRGQGESPQAGVGGGDAGRDP